MKILKIKAFLLGIAIFITQYTFAQNGTVQGNITTTNGEAISKTTVKILNTNYGSLTDNQGKYSITNLEDGNYTLSVSVIGYASQLKSFNLKKAQTLTIDFKLVESNNQLLN